MAHAIDLDAYFARIGLDDPVDTPPTFDLLCRIQFAHATTIAFENLDVLLHPRRGIAIDLPSIEAKLVRSRRGGYCFEQNGLMLAVLENLGYAVTPLSARVRVTAPPDVVTPRTHLFCRVDLEGIPWMVDVGVGGLTPTAPIRLDVADAQTTPHDVRRIFSGSGDRDAPFVHQFLAGVADDENTWRDVHEFTGETMHPIDRTVANWWTSTSAEAKFSRAVMAAIALPDGSRLTLNDRTFVHRRGIDVIEETEIETEAERLAILRDRFGLELPSDVAFGFADVE